MKYRYIWLLCMVAMLSLPVGAQDVKKSAAPLVAGEEEVLPVADDGGHARGTRLLAPGDVRRVRVPLARSVVVVRA